MGEVLKVFQYQPVLFTSTTTGAVPISLSWSFPGGNPLSGTGDTETVIYNSPGNYTVTLTATDAFGTTDSLIEPSIIRVDPVTITPGISGPIPSTIKMNEGYDLYDDSTGNPYPAISWYWQLPYGITASTEDVGVTGYVDWFTLTGTYSGSPGSSYTGNISLTVNNGFSPATSTATIEVQKIGPDETIYLNATGSNSPLVVPGFVGDLPTSLLTPTSPISTMEFGYPVDHWMVRSNFSFRGSSNRTNEVFHSTNESGQIMIVNGLWDCQTFMDVIPGFIVIQGDLYNQYSIIIVDSAIDLGLYVIQNQSTVFFLADETDFLEGLYNNYNYSISLIDNLLSNPYKILHSGNLQFINLTLPPGLNMSYIDPSGMGASGSNPMVYSSFYLNNVINIPNPPPTPPNPVYTVYITVNIAGIPYGATASIGTPGSTGNDPVTGGNFFVAQNNPNGFGFVHYLNLAINASIPGGTGSVDFVASSDYNCSYNGPSGPSYDPTNYNGVALRIIDNTLVQFVSIADNSQLINSSYAPALSFPISPFTADQANLQGSTETCIGISSNILTPISGFGPSAYNSFTLGNSIGYP
jgi:PKD repeat protein